MKMAKILYVLVGGICAITSIEAYGKKNSNRRESYYKANNGKHGSSRYLENGENGQNGGHGGNGGDSFYGNGGNGGNGSDVE